MGGYKVNRVAATIRTVLIFIGKVKSVRHVGN